jgi:hypothetical protein
MKYVLHAERYPIEGRTGVRLRESRFERGNLIPKSLKGISLLGEEGLNVGFPFLKTGFKRVQIIHYGKSARSKPLCQAL